MFAARGTTGEGGDAPDHQEEPLGLSWAPPRLRPLFLLKGFPWERIHDNVKNSWCAGDPHVPVPAVKSLCPGPSALGLRLSEVTVTATGSESE